MAAEAHPLPPKEPDRTRRKRKGKMRITVDTDRMAAISGAIRTVTGTLRDNMDAMEILVNSLSGEWQGNAGRAYASRILCVRREFREVEHFFEEYASLLSRFAENYRRHEDQLAAKIANV